MRLRRLVLAGILGAGLAAALPVRAESTRQVFDRANEALLRGETDAAIEGYQTLVESGTVDSALEYNLALARAQQDQLGKALWHLLRAQRLAPGDEGIERALRRVQDTLGKRQAAREGEATVQSRPPLAEAMTSWVGPNAVAVLLWLAVAIASLAWIALQREQREGRRLAAGVTLALALLLSGLAGAAVAVKAGLMREGERAVVLRDAVAMREGPDEKAPRVATLAEGSRADVVEVLGGHARIAVGDARGWVLRSSLGLY